MIEDFKGFVLNEKLGINSEVILLSEFIYDSIQKNNTIKKIKLSDNKLGIKIVNIEYTDNNFEAGAFIINNSDISNIFIRLKKNISIGTIYHELNHVLQFIEIGKEQYLKNHFKLCCLNITRNLFTNDEHYKIFEHYIMFKYLSLKDEIDSYVYDTYYHIKKNISKVAYNEQFDKLLKSSVGYTIYTFIKNYKINELKKIDDESLLLLFNIVEDNYGFLIKNKNNIFKSFFRKIKQLFTNKYINNLNIKIVNIEPYFQKLEEERKESEKYMLNKITRLHDLIYSEI